MNMPDPLNRPRLALIAGPTASGKSAAALELAEREDGVVVNADASQVYRDLRILTARPTAADEARAPHLLYGHVDAAVAGSAAVWAQEAAQAIAGAVTAGRLPILVGGTGLYFRTLLDGIAPVPPIEPDIRRAVRAMPVEAAYAALQQEDAAAADRLHPNDASRVQRALETIRSTSESILSWRTDRQGGIADLYAIRTLMMDIPAAVLALRCDMRVDAMFAGGGVEEVARLAERGLDPDLPAMRAIGVAPIISLLRQDISRDEAIAAVKLATRRYAKRQRTWFRNQPMLPSSRRS